MTITRTGRGAGGAGSPAKRRARRWRGDRRAAARSAGERPRRPDPLGSTRRRHAGPARPASPGSGSARRSLPEFSSARLVDGRGATVSGASLEAGTGDPRLLDGRSCRALAAGTYGVVWRVLAEDDGHTTGGIIVFTVGAAAPAGTDHGADESAGVSRHGRNARGRPAPLAWPVRARRPGRRPRGCRPGARPGRGGLGVERRRCRDPAQPAQVPGRCGRLRGRRPRLSASLTSPRKAGERRRARRDRGLVPAMLDLLTGTRWGHLWLAREAALVTLARPHSRHAVPGSAEPANRLSAARVGRAVAALVLTVAWVEALGSHAVALESARASAVVAYALHVLTALLWLGALPALVLVLWPRVPGLGRRELMRACRGPFTALARDQRHDSRGHWAVRRRASSP